MFASTVSQTLSAQVATTTKVRYGSDLVMETTGWAEEDQLLGGGGLFGGGGDGGMDDMFGGGGGGFFSLAIGGSSHSQFNIFGVSIYPSQEAEEGQIDPSRVLTTDFEELLLGIDGIEKVSSVIASPFHLTQIYADSGTTFEASIGDYAGLSSSGVRLVGVDEEYPSTVDADYIVMTRGSLEESFDEVFNNPENYTCVVSEGLALGLNLELGDKVRITITRGAELQAYIFYIVGMASAMPGFSDNFGSSSQMGMGLMMGGGSDGGVVISQNTYMDLMDIPEPAFLDKIFIKLKESAIARARSIEDEIDDNWLNNYNYNLINLERNIAAQESMFQVMDVLFTLILMATVIICLFGLLSSSYSSILERKKEIGVVRTLGLKGRDINRMFIVEALIIMLASGTIGVLVGWSTGYLLSSTLNLFTDIPYEGLFPVSNFIWLYGLSISFILVGMTILLRKLRKKKIVDIYRETM